MNDTFHLERILSVCESEASDKTKVRRIYRMAAQAIEARRAETTSGSVHESAVPKECAQPAHPTHRGD